MPVILRKQLEEKKEIGIWKISETLEELHEKIFHLGYDMEKLAGISNEMVKRQWLAVRCLLSEMTSQFMDITYDELGRPYLDGHTTISITHSHEKVGIELSPSKFAGIDMQLYTPTIVKIKEKFMSADEINNLNNDYSIESMHVIWCAKETMFKALRSEGVHFAEELHIENFKYSNQFTFNGTSTHKGIHQNFDLSFEKVEDYFLVYLVNP